MTVPFSSFPADWRLPLFWLEVDPSKAGRPRNLNTALLVGTRITAQGTAVDNQPVAVSNAAQAEALFGAGSMLARMVETFLKSNSVQTLIALPVAEPAAGVAATGTISFTGPPTSSGTFHLYIAGQKVEVAALSTDTTATFAGKVRAAVNAKTSLPVLATGAAADVILTAKWKGLTGNDIRIAANIKGALGGEKNPIGLVFTMTGSGYLTGGTSAPDFAAAIASLADREYDYVALPFTDTGSLDVWAMEYGFTDSGRWGWLRQDYGIIFTAIRDSYSNFVTTVGPSRNEGTILRQPLRPNGPVYSPVWEVAASYAGIASRAFTNDASRPLQTLELEGLSIGVDLSFDWSKAENQSLTGVGLAAADVGPNGKLRILRETMSYQRNAYGQGDTAYELATTLSTLQYLFRVLRHEIESQFPRYKLADNGTRFSPGAPIVTPKIVKAHIVGAYDRMMFAGHVENIEFFIEHLICERNAQNPDRLDVLWPPDLVNGLRIVGVLAQFRLQAEASTDVVIA